MSEQRLTFLPGAVPPPPAATPAERPAPVRPLRDEIPPDIRRRLARERRAALIAEQLGERELPLYLVDFMNVEDATGSDRSVPINVAVRTVADREGRDPDELFEAWHEAVARIASDDACRGVDALRPYIERIDGDLDGAS